MADLLWGKVYFKDVYAGVLKQEPGERFSFIYDSSYLESSGPDIAHTLPKQGAPHVAEYGLHPFFDNLISEGWLENAQARLLGKRQWKRFEILLAFGADCAGAVSVIDPEPVKLAEKSPDLNDPKCLAVMAGRASLSGIQPKLVVVKEGRGFRPARRGEVSTHIAKFSSDTLPDIIENEWLTTLACQRLLSREDFAELEIGSIKGINETALIVKRFDRTPTREKIHFEEFSQLLKRTSLQKYEAAYQDMALFLQNTPACLTTDIFRLFQRIIAGILTGNTDMHLKNFALFHTPQGLRLTPSYDQVAAAVYHPRYQSMALKIAGVANCPIGSLKGKHILALGREFQLNNPTIEMAVGEIKNHLPRAQDMVQKAPYGSKALKEKIIQNMEKRWNGTFRLIGQPLLKKPSTDAKSKS